MTRIWIKKKFIYYEKYNIFRDIALKFLGFSVLDYIQLLHFMYYCKCGWELTKLGNDNEDSHLQTSIIFLFWRSCPVKNIPFGKKEHVYM